MLVRMTYWNWPRSVTQRSLEFGDRCRSVTQRRLASDDRARSVTLGVRRSISISDAAPLGDGRSTSVSDTATLGVRRSNSIGDAATLGVRRSISISEGYCCVLKSRLIYEGVGALMLKTDKRPKYFELPALIPDFSVCVSIWDRYISQMLQWLCNSS